MRRSELMKRWLALTSGTALALCLSAVLAASAALAAGSGGWGQGQRVPGSAKLNAGRTAQILSVSCSSPGNCSAGGFITTRKFVDGAFMLSSEPYVATQRHDTWRTGLEVPGIAKLNAFGEAQVNSVSCTSAGNCAAVGFYVDGDSFNRAFVVTERDGKWGAGRELTGAHAADRFSFAELDSVSCTSAGNCLATGFIAPEHSNEIAAAVVEHNGRWGKAFDIPGALAIHASTGDQAVLVSCASAGNCTLTGGTEQKIPHGLNDSVFVESERNGKFGRALALPGLAALDTGQEGLATTVSCASAGNCVVGGNYVNNHGEQAFVDSQRNGTWGSAIEAPGTSVINTAGGASVASVSCPSAGNCSAAGTYEITGKGSRPFVLSERNGMWSNAIPVPGAPSKSLSEITSISCVSAGNCDAVGDDREFVVLEGVILPGMAFALAEVNGHWRSPVANPAWKLRQFNSISCTRAVTQCTAGGFSTDRAAHTQTLVGSRT